MNLDIKDQYNYIRNNIGTIHRDDVGCLQITGEDALDLLNRLSTNDLINFDYSNGSISTVLTTNKGRMIDLLTVVKNSKGYLIICSLRALGKVVEWINFYTIIEEICIEDISSKILYFTLVGPNSKNVLQNSGLSEFNSLNIIDSKFNYYDSVDILIDVENENTFTKYLKDLRVSYISNQIYQIIRIQEFIPVFGKEITDKFNPLEAKLEKYISFNKGCYIGQEVIARLNTYNKVKRVLVKIESEANLSINSAEKIIFKNQEIGIITSYIYNSSTRKYIGLAYIDKNFNLNTINANIGVENNIKLIFTRLESSHHLL
ncbi:MAG: hypothetical protein CL758_02295 [Chloroflexi bacterium]|nr:hypothetical protein [Chloroflexota bacterium]|tara:strand:+ start:3742 stop:4692 length:951 start_codon:yes stop_codon:yes gene_type:complete